MRSLRELVMAFGVARPKMKDAELLDNVGELADLRK
jgi:hypothetical protein